MNPITEKPKVNYWQISTILLGAIFIIAGLFYFNFGDSVKKLFVKESTSPTVNNEQTKQVTIGSIGDGWNQLKNDKYHYKINFPVTTKINKTPEKVRIIYENSSVGTGKSPFLASIDISLIGLLNEPIELTATRVASSELFERATLNGNQAIIINYKTTYSANSLISYKAILVRNTQNLNFLIRIDTTIGSKYEDLLEKAIQTFQFIDQSNLANPEKLLLSGKVFLLSGNCMPGSGGDCNKKPINTAVLIYPLKTQNKNFKGEKALPLITKTKSDRNGNYNVSIRPGTYSVYVDDNGKETCSGSDGHGNMCSLTLYESNEELNITIDNAAH